MRKRFVHNTKIFEPEPKEEPKQQPPLPKQEESFPRKELDPFKIISLTGKKRELMEYILKNVIKETDDTFIARIETAKAREALGLETHKISNYFQRLKKDDLFADTKSSKGGVRIITLDKKAYKFASPKLSII